MLIRGNNASLSFDARIDSENHFDLINVIKHTRILFIVVTIEMNVLNAFILFKGIENSFWEFNENVESN
jgi:hypothetical protein